MKVINDGSAGEGGLFYARCVGPGLYIVHTLHTTPDMSDSR